MKDEKRLKPSLRENKRYILFELSYRKRKNAKEEVKKLIENAVLDSLGVIGYAKACPIIIDIKQIKNNKIQGILAVNRKEVNKVRAALCLSERQIIVERVSGMIRKLKSD